MLTADVDLENELWTPIGDNLLHKFSGTFDGGGHTIGNLNVSLSATDADVYAGLFGVSFDASRNAVVLTSGVAYDGAAATLGADMSESAVVSPQTVELDGRSVSLTAYNIGGNNFFGLRELAQFLGYGVNYDAASNTAQITSK